jgi:hypothetical protein
MLEEHIPNTSVVMTRENPSRGCLCLVPPVSQQAPRFVQNLRYSGLTIRGPRLFNMLPREIRNIRRSSVDKLKKVLDKFLSKVPDEPLIPGYTMFRRAENNSLIHMIKHVDAQHNDMLDDMSHMSASEDF